MERMQEFTSELLTVRGISRILSASRKGLLWMEPEQSGSTSQVSDDLSPIPFHPGVGLFLGSGEKLPDTVNVAALKSEDATRADRKGTEGAGLQYRHRGEVAVVEV